MSTDHLKLSDNLKLSGRAVGRMSVPLPITAAQQELLNRAIRDGCALLAGRSFTADELGSIFRMEQIPKDPAVCAALGLNVVPPQSGSAEPSPWVLVETSSSY